MCVSVYDCAKSGVVRDSLSYISEVILGSKMTVFKPFLFTDSRDCFPASIF